MKQRREFRVVWRREEGSQRSRRYATLGGAESLVALLTLDPEDFACCDGSMCGCRGELVGDRFKAITDGPHVQVRDVGEWEALG